MFGGGREDMEGQDARPDGDFEGRHDMQNQDMPQNGVRPSGDWEGSNPPV